MVRTSNDFFNDFKKLMENNALIPDYVPERLLHYNINGRDMGPEDIVIILEGINQGNKEKLNRWNDLREYLIRTLNLIENNKKYENMSNWEHIYGLRRDIGEDEEAYVDVAEIEYRMEIIINRLLHTDFAMNTNELGNFFGIIKPSEQMGLISLERQGIRNAAATKETPERRKTLPSEIFRDEIAPFIGKKLKGGRYRTNRRKRKSIYNKRKKSYIRHNKRRSTRRK